MKKIITGLGIILTSMSAANAQLFDFDSIADAGNSNEATGVSVSGSVAVDLALRTLKFTINNDSTGSIGDMVAFGFWNAPNPAGTAEVLYSGFSHTTGNSWNGPVDRVNDLWSMGETESYEGAEAVNQGSGNDGVAQGDSAMFTFSALLVPGQDLEGVVARWTANNEDTVGSNSDLRVRFQSTPNGGSDKLYINLRAVPEPSYYGMIGASALVLLIAARRFKKK